VIINSPDPPAGGLGENEFKDANPSILLKMPAAFLAKSRGFIDFYNSIPALP